jgi:hypothetical protein
MTETVLVYGALRSGTTLLRLMLNAHPRLVCRGESDWLFDHLRPDRKGGLHLDRTALQGDRIFRASGVEIPTVADGRAAVHTMTSALQGREVGPLVLMTHRNPGRMFDLFPRARVLHLLRDPRDVARSCIGMGWAGTVYHGLDLWLETERAWDGVVARLHPGQALEIRYEELIQDAPGTLGQICEFFGETYDPAMLSYSGNTTYAAPDPALTEQWRRKLSPRDIGLIEARAGSLLAARGYAPSGHPPVRPGALQRAGLWLENKKGVWRTRIARYGIVDPLLLAVARRPGLGWLARGAKRRVEARTVAYLK